MCQSIHQAKKMSYRAEFHPSFTYRRRKDFLHESPKENPIFADLKAVLNIMQAIGLFPIFERVSRYEISASTKSNEYYSFCVRGVAYILTLFYIYTIISPDSMQWFYSNRDTDIGNKWIENILCITTFSITVFCCGLYSQKFLKIINDLLKVDEAMQSKFRTIPENDCGFSRKFLFGMGIWQGYIIASKVFNPSNGQNLVLYFNICVVAAQNGIIIIFIVFLAALLRIIAIRFAFLNLFLTRYTFKFQYGTANRMRSLNAFASMEKFPENSLFIFRMHHKLLLIYNSINECCNLILVCYMGYAFYTITENTYNIFIETTTQHVLSAVVMVWGISWLILHIPLLRLLCRNCGQATLEANNTTRILASVYVNSKEQRNVINKYLIKSIKQKAEFTAYGFFVIDNSTVFKIFSAFTTYLVILIQFKQLEDSTMLNQ